MAVLLTAHRLICFNIFWESLTFNWSVYTIFFYICKLNNCQSNVYRCVCNFEIILDPWLVAKITQFLCVPHSLPSDVTVLPQVTAIGKMLWTICPCACAGLWSLIPREVSLTTYKAGAPQTPDALPNPRPPLPFCHSKSFVWTKSNTRHLWWWAFFRSACGRSRGRGVGHSSAGSLRSCTPVCRAGPLTKDVCVASGFCRLQIKRPEQQCARVCVTVQKRDCWIARQVPADAGKKRTRCGLEWPHRFPRQPADSPAALCSCPNLRPGAFLLEPLSQAAAIPRCGLICFLLQLHVLISHPRTLFGNVPCRSSVHFPSRELAFLPWSLKHSPYSVDSHPLLECDLQRFPLSSWCVFSHPDRVVHRANGFYCDKSQLLNFIFNRCASFSYIFS